MKEIVAMVFAGGRVEELSVLTERRAKAAVVVGGHYRCVDFALSNLADFGIQRVGILAQYRPSALMDHVGIGLSWDFIGADRRVRFLPPYLGPERGEWYRGPADALYQNLDFIEHSPADHVLVVSGDHAYKMDYGPLVSFHRERAADLTVVFKPMDVGTSRFGIGELNAVGQILNFTEKPAHPRTNLANMGIYLFRRKVLVEELQRAASGHDEGTTFQIHEILKRMMPRRRAYGYVFHGDWYYTRTLDEYHAFHQGLLGSQPAIDLAAWQVRSNLMARRKSPPTPSRLVEGARVENALVSDGCVIAGTVTNSVLSPGVVVGKGAVVHDSVLWHDVVVEEGATLDRVISDKRSRFGAGAQVGVGEALPSEELPDSLRCGATVVGVDVHVPAGARVGRGCILHPEVGAAELAAPVASGKSVFCAPAPEGVQP